MRFLTYTDLRLCIHAARARETNAQYRFDYTDDRIAHGLRAVPNYLVVLMGAIEQPLCGLPSRVRYWQDSAAAPSVDQSARNDRAFLSAWQVSGNLDGALRPVITGCHGVQLWPNLNALS